MRIEYTTSVAPNDLYPRTLPAGLSRGAALVLARVLAEEVVGCGLADEMTIEVYDDSGERLGSFGAFVDEDAPPDEPNPEPPPLVCADCLEPLEPFATCEHCGTAVGIELP